MSPLKENTWVNYTMLLCIHLCRLKCFCFGLGVIEALTYIVVMRMTCYIVDEL